MKMQVYDGQTKALKDVRVFDTREPEQCLDLIKALLLAGGNISANMDAIPRTDKERLFNYLNDEAAFPTARYTKRIEEIHEALGLDLT